MIIDSKYFLSYLNASGLKISRLDDEGDDFWLKDLFVGFPNKHKIYAHSFPQHEGEISQSINFCKNNKNFFHIIILCGQTVDLTELDHFVRKQDNVFVLNDYNYTNGNFFPLISCHRTFGKGYIKNVPYVPWRQRNFTISSLSSRFEPHRWIITGELNLLKRKDITFSFHNAYPQKYDLEHFVNTSKTICDYDADERLKRSIQELILEAPIIPFGMHNPRPNGITNENTFIYDQCELGVYLDSKINLTMEGQFVDTGFGCNITEKTLKCLATGNFPLQVGQSGFYKFLSLMGFNVDVDIDLGFDSLGGDCRKTKLEMLIRLIKKIKGDEELEIVSKQNYDWFHNSWYDHCEKINQPVLEELSSRIGYEI